MRDGVTKPQPRYRRILLTGGAGFIGTSLAERFSAMGEVVLLDSFRRDAMTFAPEVASHPNVRVITGDVLDPAVVSAAFDGVDVVIHLAAIAGVSSYYREPLQTLRVNILGTVNVLEEAARRHVQHVVYFSTSEIFGPQALGVDEQAPCVLGSVSDARWVYAASKLAGEHLVVRYAEQYGFEWTIVRPFNIYGPRQVGEGAISNFCRAASQQQPLTVYGDGSAIRSWCYVTDLIDAIQAILQTPAARGQVFNIGNPRATETALGLAQRIVRLAPGATIQWQQTNRTEVRSRVPVIEHARQLLGFEPKVSLEDGVRRTLAWFMDARMAVR